MKAGQKVSFFLIWIVIAFFLLIVRLYYLQIIEGESYLQRSESNFVQERVIKHSRGRILDREGRALADNRLAYDVYVTFALLPDSLKNLRAIAQSLSITKNDLLDIDRELLERARNDIDDQIILKSNVPMEACQKTAEVARIKMMSGIEIERVFLNGEEFCQISVLSNQFPSLTQTFNLLSSLLDSRRENLDELWQKAQRKAQGLGRFKPSLLVPDVGFDAYARIENAISLGSLAGITVVPSKRRRYVYDDFATHVIGFLNQVSIADIQEHSGTYRSGDFIGRTGLEATFEDVLRGTDGIERVVVDAKGRRFDDAWEEGLLGPERISEPKSGSTIKLSIDWEMQKAAQELFTGLSGSVVITEVDTGFILAMASFPSFDLNNVVSADNAKFIKDLLADKARPLRNKAIQDHYPPGSIFKPVTAIAGLSKKLITPSYQHYCSGTYHIHRTVWRCYKREGHGPIALMQALKVSCDSYFYELGHRLGLEALSGVAQKLGFGSKTEITLFGETSGILPTREYYKKRFGYVAPGNVVNMSIGQGDLNASPIQMAVAYGAIANGGRAFMPQIVTEIINDEGEVIKKFDSVVKASVADPSYNFDEILHSMSFVTESGGSAHGLRYKPEHADIAKWLKNEKISILGKTGSAQVVKLSKLVKHVEAEDLPYEHRDHSWFVGLYPQDDPKIVVVVMTEHGGMGGAASAPVAVRLMRKWHEKNVPMVTSARRS